MRRLILIAFLTLFAAPAFALTEAETALVKKAEAYLNAITTLKARFTQVNADGASHEGDLYISRPGKMRLVYDPPTPMLMVADGVFLIYVDKDMDDVSHIDLNLANDQGRDALDTRIKSAARSVCATGSGDVRARRDEARCVREAISQARMSAVDHGSEGAF